MSVRDNSGMLILGRIARWLGFVPNRALNQQADSAVKDFGIRTASIHNLISSLSGGNQQKVVVAKALSHSTLGHLDGRPHSRRGCWREVRNS